ELEVTNDGRGGVSGCGFGAVVRVQLAKGAAELAIAGHRVRMRDRCFEAVRTELGFGEACDVIMTPRLAHEPLRVAGARCARAKCLPLRQRNIWSAGPVVHAVGYRQ